MNSHVSVRNQAVSRLTNVTRGVTAAAVAGAGLLALVVARTAPVLTTAPAVVSSGAS